jgi:hypothetical protein
VNIANTVLYMKQETQKIFSKVPPKLMACCKGEITKEFSHADDLVNNIMQPLVNSISEAIESIILTLHKENYQGLVAVSPEFTYELLDNLVHYIKYSILIAQRNGIRTRTLFVVHARTTTFHFEDV